MFEKRQLRNSCFLTPNVAFVYENLEQLAPPWLGGDEGPLLR